MLPKTGAYREIWLDDKLVKGGSDTIQDFEPIYGPTYPFKNKVKIERIKK
jgi:sulfite reductase (NADPH) hemoprotein beta-component